MSFKNDIEKAIKANSVKRLEQACIKALGKTAENIVNDAKENLRANGTSVNGSSGLLGTIYAKPVTADLRVVIEASAFYASFVEFGTRKFAADQIAKLPKEWKDIAAQTKGKTRGNFEDMVKSIAQWLSDRGKGADTAVVGRFSTKTRKRLGSKKTQEEENLRAAYPIALKILRDGVKAQPYFYPAVTKNINNFRKELDKVFK